MQRILYTLVALLMSSAAFGECALFIEDFELDQSELGTEIIVPVKAHFSARLNAWELHMTLPNGLQAIEAEAGADQRVTYYNAQGIKRRIYPDFASRMSSNSIIAVFSNEGYWQDPNSEDPNAWTSYGTVKWEGGDYDEMILLHLLPSTDFKGGDIIFKTIASSTLDSRGGTILENGDENGHFQRICHVSVKENTPSLIEVPAPVISTDMNDDNVYVTIHWPESTGQRIYTGKYTYPRGEEDAEYEVEAYVTGNNRYAESSHATKTIVVPAKVTVPQPEDPVPQIVLIGSSGVEHQYTLFHDYSPVYSIMMTLRPEVWGGNVSFYFIVDGVRYGAETDMQIPELCSPDQLVSNPVIEGENSFCIPANFTYTFGIQTTNDGIILFVAQGVTISVSEVIDGKQIAGMRYFNMAGQEMQEADGMTIVVTTYTDGTTSATKVMK